jgi:hypothetical protein
MPAPLPPQPVSAPGGGAGPQQALVAAPCGIVPQCPYLTVGPHASGVQAPPPGYPPGSVRERLVLPPMLGGALQDVGAGAGPPGGTAAHAQLRPLVAPAEAAAVQGAEVMALQQPGAAAWAAHPPPPLRLQAMQPARAPAAAAPVAAALALAAAAEPASPLQRLAVPLRRQQHARRGRGRAARGGTARARGAQAAGGAVGGGNPSSRGECAPHNRMHGTGSSALVEVGPLPAPRTCSQPVRDWTARC